MRKSNKTLWRVSYITSNVRSVGQPAAQLINADDNCLFSLISFKLFLSFNCFCLLPKYNQCHDAFGILVNFWSSSVLTVLRQSCGQNYFTHGMFCYFSEHFKTFEQSPVWENQQLPQKPSVEELSAWRWCPMPIICWSSNPQSGAAALSSQAREMLHFHLDRGYLSSSSLAPHSTNAITNIGSSIHSILANQLWNMPHRLSISQLEDHVYIYSINLNAPFKGGQSTIYHGLGTKGSCKPTKTPVFWG